MKRATLPLFSCYIVLLLLLSALMTPQAQSQRVFDTDLLATELGHKHALWEDAHHRRPGPTELIMIPMLDVYSPAGTLIYHGGEQDTGKAAQVLNALPKFPSSTPSPDVQMSLNEILEITPDLAKWKDTIIKRHHFVVVSTSVQGHWKIPNPYSEQNQAVDSVLKRPGANIDVVRINIIFPKN